MAVRANTLPPSVRVLSPDILVPPWKMIISSSTSVSYTHLDVYKRQGVPLATIGVGPKAIPYAVYLYLVPIMAPLTRRLSLIHI